MRSNTNVQFWLLALTCPFLTHQDLCRACTHSAVDSMSRLDLPWDEGSYTACSQDSAMWNLTSRCEVKQGLQPDICHAYATQSPTLRRGLMQGLQRRPQVLLLPPNGLQERGLFQGMGPCQAHHGHSRLRSFLRELAAAVQLRAGRAEDGCLDQPAGPLLGIQACPGHPQAPRFT